MSEPLLTVEDQRTAFATGRGLVRAVDGVSFTLERGRTLGVVGESGSGKSVLSRSIMRLLPPNARSSGAVRLGGRDLTAMSEKALRALRGPEISIVFQDPMTSLNPVMTIGAQIGEVLTRHLGMSRKAAKARSVELLASVGLPQPDVRVDQHPHQLSGGMRQRVAIAIAIACEPALLIADEPTTALDVTVQAEILDLLARQQAERNMAMILITHDMGVVAGRCDDVAVMYAGRIVEQASTEDLFRDTRMPYTSALLASIPRLDDPPHRKLEAIPGRPPDLIHPPAGCAFSPRCRYADDLCRAQPPALEEAGRGHRFACWRPMAMEAAE
ncbi:MAG: dipeptide/oligopeptide/nickel ABC transporter ATP-binding protein [Rhodobacteraceae bacterium]|nr:dipeptide/oligopeptide/nickel ABC transporter ATP-binding protein [Paracoccaceae bacterium]MBR26830.1 dipeptide/oligopeptide/nickel ABC transporter ATP-binding protein [Paracoccaceae bacterium]